TVKPVGFAVERWMRMPATTSLGPRDLFVFSGYADFTGGPESLQGDGDADTAAQETWIEYDIVEMRVGPHWLRVDGISPVVVIGGHSQGAPDVADAMGFRVQAITDVNVVQTTPGVRRIDLGVNVTVRGGLDGKILSLAYQVTAFGALASPIGTEGIFFAGAS